MTVEIISWSISTKVWYRAGIELATPGSAVRHASVARHVTDCATRPGATNNDDSATNKCFNNGNSATNNEQFWMLKQWRLRERPFEFYVWRWGRGEVWGIGGKITLVLEFFLFILCVVRYCFSARIMCIKTKQKTYYISIDSDALSSIRATLASITPKSPNANKGIECKVVVMHILRPRMTMCYTSEYESTL